MSKAIQQIDEIDRRLAAAKTAAEVRPLVNLLGALKRVAKQEGADLEDINKIAEKWLRGMRRGGALLIEAKERGERHNGHGDQKSEYRDSTPILNDIGINKHQSSDWQAITSLSPETFEQFIAETKEDKEELTKIELLRLVKHGRRNGATHPAEEKASIELANAIDWLERQGQCDLLLTDPPYSTDVDDIGAFARNWLSVALAHVKPTGRAYIFIGAYPNELLAYLSVQLPTQVLVWEYRNTIGPLTKMTYKQNWQAILYYCFDGAPSLNGDCLTERFSVQSVNAPDGRHGERFHAWEKPMPLSDILIAQATQPGNIVFDPFAGTGTFLLSAAKLGRLASGCDVSPEMVNIAVERGCTRIELDS